MIHLRPASLLAFTRDALAALPLAENRRLRAANYGLQWDVTRLTQIADQLAAANRDLAEDLATSRRALAQAVNHPRVRAADFDFDGPEPPADAVWYDPPTFAQPIPDSEIADGLGLLDRDDLNLGDVILDGGWSA